MRSWRRPRAATSTLLDWKHDRAQPFGDAFPGIWQLDEDEREILIRRFVEGWTLLHYAIETGTTRDNARTLERRALERLAAAS